MQCMVLQVVQPTKEVLLRLLWQSEAVSAPVSGIVQVGVLLLLTVVSRHQIHVCNLEA